MPTSKRAPPIGLPTFCDSIRASSSACSSTSVASRRSRRARSSGETARQAGKAAFARATAASVCSTSACSSSAIGCSVAGFSTVRVILAIQTRIAPGAALRGAAANLRGTRCAMLGTVGGRLRDELLEELPVLASLRMPEDAEGEAPRRILDRLDGAVLGHRGHAQPLAEAPESLMVVRLDRRALAEQLPEPASRLERDVVVREDAGRVLVLLVADDVREVLHEVAAKRDVQDLRAAADREHRQVARERRLEQRQLGAVALRHEAERLRMRLLPVELRIEVDRKST